MENIVDEFENWDYSSINLPGIKADFAENDIYTVYNEEQDNYDIMSRIPDYKGEEYKIITCDKNGIAKNEQGYNIDLKLTDHDDYNFYNYVCLLQTLKSDEKYKDFNVSYRGDITEIDFNNDDFNRKLILHDGWDGWSNVEYKLVLEQYGDADIDVYNKCIGEIYDIELYQNSKDGKLGNYYILKNHSDENNLYNLYYLSDQRSYVNISDYIDDLIDDMDKISDMKDVIEKKITGNINKNQELFRQALSMDQVNNSTSNVRYIDGDFDSDVIYDRPQGVSPKITEEEFIDVMNELNESINKKYDNEIKL